MNEAQTRENALKTSNEHNDTRAKPDSFEDLLITAIPAMISSLTLEAVSAFNGLQKIGIATLAGVTLWGLTRRRSGGRNRLPAASRKHWRWALMGLVCVTLAALIITVIAFSRPTPVTVIVSTLVLGTVAAAAVGTGRRLPGALAAALSGGIIGLCTGIAFL